MNSPSAYEYTLTIRGEAAMAACAAALAHRLNAGDCLLLTGTLGTGKTTFARGVIQALCGERTEVVSPTFMLVQDYDALPEHGAFRIQHYDLYRLEHPDELWELGVEEAFGHALLLVEWPEVAGDYWSQDRLEIAISHDESNDACRRLHLHAQGSMVARTQQFCQQWDDSMSDSLTAEKPATLTRRDLMERFVAAAGWEGAELKPLAGDASFRRYERVFWQGKQAVLMDAPPEHEDVRPFVKVGRYLESLGFSAPHIIAEDHENGFLLLEDLGDDSYSRVLKDADAALEEQLYKEAVGVLAELHVHNKTHGAGLDVPAYNYAALMREIELFADWYLPAVMGKNATTEARAAEFKALWASLLQQHPLQNDVVVLRDYHADNLLWLPERAGTKRVGQLDFQDALIGHAAYDLVSLLEDARRDVRPETVESALTHYCQKSGANRDELMAAYALLGAQRQAKIIGIFVRLGVRDGKKHYTNFLPRVWAHFEHDLSHPLLADIRRWVDAHIPQEWRGAISL